jgi:hypothetical protein
MMADIYIIDKKILKKGRDMNQCLCKLEKTKCPCDDFLENDICVCGAYKKIKIKEDNKKPGENQRKGDSD